MRSRRAALKVAIAFAAVAAPALLACSFIVETSGLAADADSRDGSGAEGGHALADATGASTDASAPNDASTDADATPVPELYAAAVMSDAPVAYFRLEELGTGTAKNEVNAPAGAYPTNAMHGVPGAFSGSLAMALDGTAGSLALGSSYGPLGTAPFSLELWFQPAVNDTTARYIACSYQFVDGGKEAFDIWTHATTGVTVDRQVAGVKKSTTAIPALAPGVFHHLVVTYDGSQVALFVDGAFLASFADTRPSFATNPGLTIGAFWAPDPVSVIGAVDEVALYDKALSSSRISAHFKASGR